MERKDQISGVFWFLVSLLIIQQSLTMNLGDAQLPGPGMLPLILGIIIAVLSGIVIVRASLRIGPDTEPIRKSWFYTPRLAVTVAGLIAYTFLFTKLGFFATTFLLMVLLFFEKDQRGIWSPLVKAALTVAGGYILFHVLLDLQFPTGPWGMV